MPTTVTTPRVPGLQGPVRLASCLAWYVTDPSLDYQEDVEPIRESRCVRGVFRSGQPSAFAVEVAARTAREVSQ